MGLFALPVLGNGCSGAVERGGPPRCWRGEDESGGWGGKGLGLDAVELLGRKTW